MKATPEQITDHQIMPPAEVMEYAIDVLNVHPDFRIVDPAIASTALTSGLAERQFSIGYAHTEASVAAHYLQRQKAGNLPPHLNSSASFIGRHAELVGATGSEIALGEVVDTVHKNRTAVPQDVQQSFEYSMARFGELLIADEFGKNPSFYRQTKARVTFSVEGSRGSTTLSSGDGMEYTLPRNHAGIVQCTPIINDTLARLDEMASGVWENVALLSSTYFSEGMARNLQQRSYKIGHKRLFTTGEGIAAGVRMLQDEKQGNKRIKKGFGAIILSDVGHRPVEDIHAAIDAAPALLAAGGILAISELDTFQDGRGSVAGLINRAREVFSAEPTKLGPLTMDASTLVAEKVRALGQQAIFVKR